MTYRYYIAVTGRVIPVPVRYRAGASSTGHTQFDTGIISCLTKDGIHL